MRKRIKPECPYCGSHDISGWYNEHNIEYVVRCNGLRSQYQIHRSIP